MKPKVFIASSTGHLDIAYAVQESLGFDADTTVWNQGILTPTDSVLSGLVRAAEDTDFAVFVLAPDDLVTIHAHEHTAARDNVIFESGLFIGALGRNRCFFIVPKESERLRLPSDLLGIVTTTFDSKRRDLLPALGPACNTIRRSIGQQGQRGVRKLELVETQRDVYVYVFNRLNPYSDLTLTQDFLRHLPHKTFTNIDDVLYPLDSFIHNYVPRLIDDKLRVYFAYRVENGAGVPPPAYRIGISFSRYSKKWSEGLPVGVPSNIHRTYSRKGISRVRNARHQIATPVEENQRVEDEGSVIAVPVLYGDEDGNSGCIGVVGISSPDVNEATDPKVEEFAHELGVLFSALFYAYGRFLQRERPFNDVVLRLREEIAEHFESKFETV